MDLNWQPELDDYIDSLHAKPPTRSARQTLIRLLLAVLVLSALFLIAIGAYEQAFYAVLFLVELSLVLAVAAFTARRTGAKNRRTKAATRLWRKHPELHVPAQAVVSLEDGIRLTAGPRSAHHTWAAVRWVTETERSMILGVRPSVAAGLNIPTKIIIALGTTFRLALPKRALADPDQVDDLRALLLESAAGRYAAARRPSPR